MNAVIISLPDAIPGSGGASSPSGPGDNPPPAPGDGGGASSGPGAPKEGSLTPSEDKDPNTGGSATLGMGGNKPQITIGAQELDGDADMQTWINAWLVDAITLVVGRNSAQIASLISDTVKSWDGADTSRRVELAIGRDLQFIRINGTLVGGLVGLLIHAFKLYI